MKKLHKWVPHELTTNQKHRHFEVPSSLILRDNSEQFLIRLRHAKASGFYMTTGKDQLSGWTKKKLQSTSQSQTCTRTRSWSLFDGLLPVWSMTAFWIPVKPLHWELSSANRWEAPKTAMPTAGIVQQKGLNSSLRQHPTSCRTTSASKVEWIGLQSFASSTIFPWTLTNKLPLTSSSISTTFCKGNAFQEFIKSRSTDFHATGINKLISHWQKCVDHNGSYFDE